MREDGIAEGLVGSLRVWLRVSSVDDYPANGCLLRRCQKMLELCQSSMLLVVRGAELCQIAGQKAPSGQVN